MAKRPCSEKDRSNGNAECRNVRRKPRDGDVYSGFGNGSCESTYHL
ncbi:Protein of unknown function [Pyronema omphalodes CBS 100304]|uniref:Uncharacterized protein n=1 Tax=Pyronema omphalodes (strain CBS 100304) TaxID=1076935 RepID=U4LNJ1_PYROM|nr:Protein of unknown function [Pyronema omphalodes CBS 100304]